MVEGNNSLSRTAMAACASLPIGLNIFTCSTAFNEVIVISNYRFFLVKVRLKGICSPCILCNNNTKVFREKHFFSGVHFRYMMKTFIYCELLYKSICLCR